MIVFFGPHEHPFLPVLHLRKTSLTVTTLQALDKRMRAGIDWRGEAADWSEIEPWTRQLADIGGVFAGHPELAHQNRVIKNVPGAGDQLFVCRGKVTLETRGMLGHDEWVDFSIWDFPIDHEGRPLGVFNRFAETRQTKIDRSWRYRAYKGYQTLVNVCVPFASDPLEQATFLVNAGSFEPIGVKPDRTMKPGTDGRAWVWPFYRIEADYDPIIARDEVKIFPVRLVWNETSELVTGRQAEFRIESDAGYIPKRRLRIDEGGAGVIRVDASGLDAGDIIKVKIGTPHYTTVGALSIKVVDRP